jgi:hypothetical protein
MTERQEALNQAAYARPGRCPRRRHRRQTPLHHVRGGGTGRHRLRVMVGTQVGFEMPLTVDVYDDRSTRSTRVQSYVCPRSAVDRPYAAKKIAGFAPKKPQGRQRQWHWPPWISFGATTSATPRTGFIRCDMPADLVLMQTLIEQRVHCDGSGRQAREPPTGQRRRGANSESMTSRFLTSFSARRRGIAR